MNTEILIILDRSGSMHALTKDVIGGFNSFIDSQRTLPGEARVTLVQFSDASSLIYEAKPLAEVGEMTTFKPGGSTALLDAIGQTLDRQGKRIAGEKWAKSVVVVIITDGEENASHEYSNARIREMIAHAENHDWKFIYLGANQDAFAVGTSLGISKGMTMSYAANAVGTQTMYSTVDAFVRTARTPSTP